MAYTVSMLNTNTNANPVSVDQVVEVFLNLIKTNDSAKAEIVATLIDELSRTYKEYTEFLPEEAQKPQLVGYLRGKMYGFETALHLLKPYEGIKEARERSEKS